RLVAEGWVHKARGWGVNEFITDPTDTVRLRIDAEGAAEFMSRLSFGRVGRWYDSRAYGYTGALVEDLEATVADLLAKAAEHAARRAAIEGKQVEEAIAEAKPVAVPEHLGITVRYSRAEGVLLCGATATHSAVIKKERSPYRYRYSRRLPK